LSKSCIRPADIRARPASNQPAGPRTTGVEIDQEQLARRRIPAIVAPASELSGGSKVLTALSPGASADSITAPAVAAPISRAVISTSAAQH